MAQTNIIDAISNLEVGKTITVKKTSNGNVAHKVTLTTSSVSAEKQDLSYDKDKTEYIDAISQNCHMFYSYNSGYYEWAGNGENYIKNQNTSNLLTSIQDYAFYSGYYYDSEQSIGYDFGDNTNLILPNVQSIGHRAFYGATSENWDYCSGFLSVILNNCRTIDDEAFEWRKIRYLHVPELVTIGENAFIFPYELLTDYSNIIQFPKVTNIGRQAFYGHLNNIFSSDKKWQFNSLTKAQMRTIIFTNEIFGGESELYNYWMDQPTKQSESTGLTIECKDGSFKIWFDYDESQLKTVDL